MPALSKTDQANLLIRVLESSLQTDGWSRILDFIDNAINCRSFLAEFDEHGTPGPQFGGERQAVDLGDVLQQIETESGRCAFRFLISEAALFYPYCKTNLARGETDRQQTNLCPPRQYSSTGKDSSTGKAHEEAGDPGDDAQDSLRDAPGLVSPIWRRGKSTILFGCLFPAYNSNDIDVTVATESFRAIVQALVPALDISFQREQERQKTGFQQLLLSALDEPAILINTDRDILAQSGNVMEALARFRAATGRDGKLIINCQKLETAITDFAGISSQQHDPAASPRQNAFTFLATEGPLRRIAVSVVPPSPALSGQATGPLFLIRLSEAGDVPEAIEKCLQENFDLSQSEAHLTRHLTMTGSMTTTVSDLGITRNTAKTHLRRIYEKTGVNTQLQLARLVHKLAQLF